MQRRVAAIYFALFLVIGAGAYAYTGVAEKPHVSIEGPAYTAGDNITANGTVYTVNALGKSGGGGGGGHGGGGGESSFVGNLTWTDESAQYTATIANNSTVSWPTVTWDSQNLDRTALQTGETVGFNGSTHRVETNTTASPPALRLVEQTNESNASVTTVPRGETVTVRHDGAPVLGATVDSVTAEEVELVQADPYRVVIANSTDPSTMSFVQQINVTRRLREDPSVFNETSTNTGVEQVDYINGSSQPLTTYLPNGETKAFSEGDTLMYNGNATTIGNITTSVPLSWTGVKQNLIDLSEGGSVSLGGTDYLVHFNNESTVQIVENTSSTWDEYHADQERIDKYNERMAGLWGVTILSFFAAFILLAAAYLPVKD